MTELLELSTEHSLLDFKVARPEDLDARLINVPVIAGVSETRIPGEVRAKFHRGEDRSDVWADVQVECRHPLYSFAALVHVKITYRGDLVRSTDEVRRKVSNRLAEIAQVVCLETLKQHALPEREIGYTSLGDIGPKPKRRRKK